MCYNCFIIFYNNNSYNSQGVCITLGGGIMKIVLNRKSDISLSQQIHDHIADRIRSNLLKENSPLPSIRNLAKKCNVSMMTANKAYETLEKEGLITRIQGKGTFVQKKTNKALSGLEEQSPSFNWQLTISDYLPRAQSIRFNNRHERIQLSQSTVYPGLLPNRHLEQEIKKVLSDDPQILSTYGDIKGDFQFRKELTNYLKQFKLKLAPSEVLITNGVQQGIDLVARSFIGPGDIVITEGPTYAVAIDVFRGRGATIIPIPVDEEGMKVELLSKIDKKPKLIYTIPSFQNPTGTVLSNKRRSKLLTYAQMHGAIIVEDDSLSELYFDSKPPLPLKSMDEEGHVIYLKGFSKTLSPGCRIGVVAASGTIYNRLLSAKTMADLGSPLVTQKAILSFIKSNKMKSHLQKLRITLKIRRDHVVSLLNQYAPDGVHWNTCQGGLNIWLTLPPFYHTDEIFIEANKLGLSFLPSSACYPGEPETNHMRICFSSVEDQLLEEGIILLCQLLSQYLATTANQSNIPTV